MLSDAARELGNKQAYPISEGEMTECILGKTLREEMVMRNVAALIMRGAQRELARAMDIFAIEGEISIAKLTADVAEAYADATLEELAKPLEAPSKEADNTALSQ